jgi:urease accessory protein
MFAAISRSEPEDCVAPRVTELERGDGAAEIVFAPGGLARLYQKTPCRVLFPQPEPGDLPVAALLTTSGGLTGGDRLRLAVAVTGGARAIAATVAAEKIYRSLGGDADVAVALRVEAGGWLEWLPQETILFDGARLVRTVDADLAPAARLLAVDAIVFGRTARGERFRRGKLFERWRVRVGGRLVWADALQLEGSIAARLGAPTAFADAVAVATALYVGGDAGEHLSLARSLAEAGAGGATLVNGVLLARFLARDAQALRRALMRYLVGLRQRAAGLPPALPRLWQT